MITRFRIRLSAPSPLFPPRVLKLWFWLFLTLTTAAYNQVPDLRMQYYSHEKGLYSSSINDVVQDSTGYIWVAGGDGLFRYDAYGFKGYYPDESDSTSLSSGRINCLFIDAGGILWIGTEAGLHTYESSGDRFKRIPVPGMLPGAADPPIRHIGVDQQGHLLIGTDHQVFVSRANEKEFELLIQHDEGQISSIITDAAGNYWIGCWENCGLKRYSSDGQTVKLKASPSDLEFLSGLRVTDLVLREDELWIATLQAGVMVYQSVTGELTRYTGTTWDENMVVGIYPDRAGNIWTIDYGGIKIRRNNGQIIQVFYTDADDPETIRSGVKGIFEDNQGNYWIYHKNDGLGISVKRKGFNRLDAYTRKFLSTTGLNVNCIQEDGSGNLWIGLSEGGIRLYNMQDMTVEDFSSDRQDPYSLGRGSVLALYKDTHGTMWIGTYYDGLQYYQASTGRFITFRHNPDDPHSIAGNDIRSIVEDKDGNLWVAVHGTGIDCFDPSTNRFTHFNESNSGLSNNWPFQLLVDEEGGLWAGTAWGLNYLEKGSKRFVNFLKIDGEPVSLSDNFITTLHLDEIGTLWVGTQNGLNRFHPEDRTFSRYLNSGRYSYIAGILSDEKLNLWISHRSGLLRFDPKNGELTGFESHDGLQSGEYMDRSLYRSPSGMFYFGGKNGIDLFRPSELSMNTTPPGIVIDQVRILDRDARIDSAGTPVSVLVNPSGTLTLKPSQFMVTLSFKALSFVNPENNRYRTMLEGLDNDWTELGTNREVSYTNLDAGSYTFRVMGSNNDGVWSTKEATLEITKLPRWYHTWLFRIASILVILGVIYMIFAMRTASLRARASLLDRMVREKTLELQQKSRELEVNNRELEKSNSTQNKLISIIAHDLVNPFNSLIGFSDLLKSRIDELSVDERKSYSELIHSSARSAFALLQNLLTWARSQSGRIKYLPEIFDLRMIIQDILELNMVNLKTKSIRFETDCREDVCVLGDREMISTVLRNLVNNSIKFVQKDGKIILYARKENGKVRVEVKDSGIGMSAEKIREILDSTTVSPSRGTGGEMGSGLGLSLCKEFIQLHGGELEIRSEVGKGSTFSFTLPAEGKK